MPTIIDGRGNVHDDFKKENKRKHIKDEELPVMSIEEYRNLQLTPEQEWDAVYNPKRVSIEAAHRIAIRKRGKGPNKEIYINADNIKCGPCYDPACAHVHIWKDRKFIPNFIGEQNPAVEHIQYTDDKPGMYCSICHIRKYDYQFKWHQNMEIVDEIPSVLQNKTKFDKCNYIENPIVFPKTSEAVEEIDTFKTLGKWSNIMFKVMYTIQNEKTVYPVSPYKSLYLWPWEMSPYQKFKTKCPDYRKSVFIMKSETEKFSNDYAIIQ